jgi:phage tail sheath protein FI
MNIHLSPGVYTFEKDLSQYAPKLSTTIVGLLGITERGPVNKPVLSTNMSQWLATFGKPKEAYPYTALAAEQYFQWGSTLYTVRVVPNDAEVAQYKIAPLFCENAGDYTGIDPDTYMMKFTTGGKSIVAKLDAVRILAADVVVNYPVVIDSTNRIMKFDHITVGLSQVAAFYVIAKGVYHNASSFSTAINTALETGYDETPVFNTSDVVTTAESTTVSGKKVYSIVSGGRITLCSHYDFAFSTNNANGATLGFAQKLLAKINDTLIIAPASTKRITFDLPSVIGGMQNYVELSGGTGGVSYTPAELVTALNYQFRSNVRKPNENRSYGAFGLITATLVDEVADTDSEDPLTGCRYSIKLNTATPMAITSDVSKSTIFNPNESGYLIWSELVYLDTNKSFTAQEVVDAINAATPNGEVIASTYGTVDGTSVCIQAADDLYVDYIANNCYSVLGIANDAGETTWAVGTRKTIVATPQHVFGNSLQFATKGTFTIGPGADTMLIRIGEDIDEERELDGYSNIQRVWDCQKAKLDLSYAVDEAGTSYTMRQNIKNYYTYYKLHFSDSAYGVYTVGKMCKVLNDTLKLNVTSDASNWERLSFITPPLAPTLPYPKWVSSESSAPPVKFINYNGYIVAVCQAINPHLSLTDSHYNTVDMKFGQAIVFYRDEGETDFDTYYTESVDVTDNLGSILGYEISEAVPENIQAALDVGVDPTAPYYFLCIGNGGQLADASANTNPVIDSITATSAGTWANNLRLVVYYSDYTGCNLSVQELNETTLEYDEVERYSNVVFNETLKDTTHTYIGDIKSSYLTFDLTPDVPYEPIYEFPVAGTYRLAGGSDGTVSGDLTAELIGTPEVDSTTGWATGLHIFAVPEKIDINTIICPYYGAIHWQVGIEATAMCAARGDAMYIWDTPQGLSAQEAIDWHNGEYRGGPETSLSPGTSLNSSYAALYWPWIKVYDTYNGKNRWVPPSGLIAGQYAFNDNVAESWYAPAGMRRGHLDIALDTEYVPTLGERDMLYGNGNAVNSVVDFRREGVIVWGQRTLQRMPSALDRVNVRRLLLYLRKVISTVSMYFVFEPNDAFTWNAWKAAVTPFLEDVQRRRGLEEYKVLMDETTVTDQARSENRMPGKIFIVPTKAAEMIEITFVINRSGNLGVDFEE